MMLTETATKTCAFGTKEWGFAFEGKLDRELLEWILDRLPSISGFGVKYATHGPDALISFSTEDADLAVLAKLTWGGDL